MITMRRLGKYGRFGNQIFQYAFLRIASGGDYQCPPWIGQYLFGHKDPPVTRKLRTTVRETKVYDADKSRVLGRNNINIEGHFQYHTSFYAPHRDSFCSWFQPVGDVRTLVSGIVPSNGTTVGVHLRRGAYARRRRNRNPKQYFAAPTEWYTHWLSDNASRLTTPVTVFVASTSDEAKSDFPERLTSNVDITAAPYYPDFYALTQCDVLLLSNSSFGFAASMLNSRAKEFWRPNSDRTGLEPYDPWNAHTQLR